MKRSVFLSCRWFACLTICDDSCLSVSHPERPSIGLSVILPACPLLSSSHLSVTSLLLVLSVAVLPNDMSACRLACQSSSHAACLCVCHPVRLSFDLSVFLSVCRLLSRLSLSLFCPCYLSACRPVFCLHVILPICPSVCWIFNIGTERFNLFHNYCFRMGMFWRFLIV